MLLVALFAVLSATSYAMKNQWAPSNEQQGYIKVLYENASGGKGLASSVSKCLTEKGLQKANSNYEAFQGKFLELVAKNIEDCAWTVCVLERSINISTAGIELKKDNIGTDFNLLVLCVAEVIVKNNKDWASKNLKDVYEKRLPELQQFFPQPPIQQSHNEDLIQEPETHGAPKKGQSEEVDSQNHAEEVADLKSQPEEVDKTQAQQLGKVNPAPQQTGTGGAPSPQLQGGAPQPTTTPPPTGCNWCLWGGIGGGLAAALIAIGAFLKLRNKAN